jgi:hypothetical protein
LRLHLPGEQGAGRGRGVVAGRAIRGVLDRAIVGKLRGWAGRQRSGRCAGSARSADRRISCRQRTEARSIAAAHRTTASRRNSRVVHHAAIATAAVATAAAAAAASAERAAAVAEDGAAAHRTESVVLADAERSAAAAATATAYVRDQAETTSGKRLGRHDARDDHGQYGGGKQFFHDGGVRECSTGGAGQHP